MSIADPNLAKELAQREHQLSALRATFLIASHHGVALRPEELPALVDGDLVPSVTAALGRAGFTPGCWTAAPGRRWPVWDQPIRR